MYFANMMMICGSHQRGGPNAPVILYRHTEITASPSGNSGLPMGQEQGSLSDNDDSSETNDEMDPVSSKKYGLRDHPYCKDLTALLGVENVPWSRKNVVYKIIYIDLHHQSKLASG